jgi:ABC-2 type transport system ATP-binding protein
MSNEPSVVRTIGLAKVFKDFWRRDKVVAVQDLDLDIRPGEVFGLLGPNGSGKSTTIKMLLGLLHPSRGRISIFGRPPTDVAIKARIGYLPEESYLYRFLNARETLDLYGKLFDQGGKIRAQRVETLLEMVGLQHQSNRRIGEYSKGMARRIGLAQALINDPDFLILDEPTTGMDPIGTRQIKELIRELARRGKTILLSSHLLSDVQDVCDRLCILYGGKVQAEGEVGELLAQHNSTQINTDRLSDGTVAEIREVIRKRDNHEKVEVTHPAERLENYFIRIVEEAQASIATSGVTASGGVADFLAEKEGEGLIESLVGASVPETPAAETPAASTPDPAGPADRVLQELVGDTSQQSESTPPTDSKTTPTKADETDRSVIDALLGRDEESRGG